MTDASSITIPLALLAGIASFISPCVLPLVPAYLGYLAGQATNTANNLIAAQGGGEAAVATAPAIPSRWIVTLHGVFFVLGFSTLFILLGFGVGALGQLSIGLNRASEWISRAGGLLVIVLGLHVMGVIRIPFLYYDTRSQQAPKQELGFLGSFLMGISFSAGWSPCIGPILGAVLTLSFSEADAGRAAILLTVFSLGLGIPFILMAMMMERATGFVKSMQKHMPLIEKVAGGFLILVGLLLISGQIQVLSGQLAGVGDLTIAIDEWLLTLTNGGG